MNDALKPPAARRIATGLAEAALSVPAVKAWMHAVSAAMETARSFPADNETSHFHRFAAETVARRIWKEAKANGVHVPWPSDMSYGARP